MADTLFLLGQAAGTDLKSSRVWGIIEAQAKAGKELSVIILQNATYSLIDGEFSTVTRALGDNVSVSYIEEDLHNRGLANSCDTIKPINYAQMIEEIAKAETLVNWM